MGRFTPEKAFLLVIDVQGKLAEIIWDKESLYHAIQKLLQAASLLELPILCTEQMPEKIGKTVPEIEKFLHKEIPMRKTSFSCCGDETFLAAMAGTGRRQAVVCGIETHVCVYQTVSDLMERGYAVQVVADAVSSRSRENKEVALRRMESLGAFLTTSEMILMELMATAEAPAFKSILRLIK